MLNGVKDPKSESRTTHRNCRQERTHSRYLLSRFLSRAHLDTSTIAEVSCSLSLRGTSGERESTTGNNVCIKWGDDPRLIFSEHPTSRDGLVQYIYAIRNEAQGFLVLVMDGINQKLTWPNCCWNRRPPEPLWSSSRTLRIASTPVRQLKCHKGNLIPKQKGGETG